MCAKVVVYVRWGAGVLNNIVERGCHMQCAESFGLWNSMGGKICLKLWSDMGGKYFCTLRFLFDKLGFQRGIP